MNEVRHAVMFLLPFVMLAAHAGCSDESLAADFDQSCATAADCVTVAVGDMCNCDCQDGAINKRDLSKYNERRAEITCSTLCSECQDPKPAVCTSGVCSVAE